MGLLDATWRWTTLSLPAASCSTITATATALAPVASVTSIPHGIVRAALSALEHRRQRHPGHAEAARRQAAQPVIGRCGSGYCHFTEASGYTTGTLYGATTEPSCSCAGLLWIDPIHVW